MSFLHRIPSLWTAFLASAAIAFCILAGTTCNFVELNAEPGNLLLSGNGVELMEVTASLGVLCENEFYGNDDKMWSLSQIFLYVSLALGGTSVLLAWAISTLLAPSELNWRLLSFLSAATAVLQVPIFLIFESEPCSGSKGTQKCSLSAGSYYLMASTIGWILVTFCTQCLDPPLWAMELSSWRVPKHVGGRNDDGVVDAVIEAKPRRKTRQGWASRLSQQRNMEVPATGTDPLRDDEFDLESPLRLERQRSPDTRVILDNPPQGKSPVVPSDLGALHRVIQPELPNTTKSGGYQNSFIQSSSPSRATEKIRVIGTSQSPSRYAKAASPQPRTGKTAPKQVSQYNSSEVMAQQNYSKGLQTLTKKLKTDTKRRRARRRPLRGGYQQMLDDDYESDDEPFMSPPIEVKIGPFANFDDVDFLNNQDFTDDEKEDLMDDWNALHKATTAGVRMGIQEGITDEKEKIDFDATFDGYHSDPEPVYYASDNSLSLVSVSKVTQFQPQMQGEGDHSTLSSKGARSRDGEKSRGSRSRRQRTPNSPIVSIASDGSLLALTINEETDQDILEEISHGDDDLRNGYSSAPDIRSKPKRQRHTRQLQPGQSIKQPILSQSPKSERQNTKELGTVSSTEVTPLLVDSNEPVAHVQMESVFLSATELHTGFMGSPVGPLPEITSPLPLHQYAPTLHPQTPPAQTYVHDSSQQGTNLEPEGEANSLPRSRSLSPAGYRSLQPRNQKTDASSLGGIHSNGRGSESSSHGDLIKRAREFRIKRMQRMNQSSIQSKESELYMEDRKMALTHSPSQPGRQQGENQVHEEAVQSFSQSPEALEDAKATDPRGADPVLSKATENIPAIEHADSDEDLSKFSFATSVEGMSKFSVGTGKSGDLPVDAEAIMQSFTESEPQPTIQEEASDSDGGDVFDNIDDTDIETKYGNFVMDDLDLQLIAVRRPIGREYGDDEASL